MNIFIRCLSGKDKKASLASAVANYREGREDSSVYTVELNQFKCIPGFPFSYWVGDSIQNVFMRNPKFDSEGRAAKQGIATADDFRFLRGWWEISSSETMWKSFAKGGGYSPFYSDLDLVINWSSDGSEVKEFRDENGKLRSRPQNLDYCLRPGITWSLRPSKEGSFRAMPADTVFSIMGSAAFVNEDCNDELMCLLALCNSRVFNFLIGILSSRGGEGSNQTKTYDVGCLSNTPVPLNICESKSQLAELSERAYEIQKILCSIDELDHGFFLPEVLAAKSYDFAELKGKYRLVDEEINLLVSRLYGLEGEEFLCESIDTESSDYGCQEDFDAADCVDYSADPKNDLLSWCVGVAFGRFDIRLATGERRVLLEQRPFAPLPVKSPGMLPIGSKLFHQHAGILVDDLGHTHDLARLVEQVLEIVDAPVAEDVRRWLQKDFFDFHLKRYSKSRRKAPIYWPLATASGSYTLWLYYPSLSDQTLFTAVNDFVDPKLEHVRKELQTLRDKGTGRSKQDEKSLEALVSLEHELADLRDSLLEIAPSYRPNHDDGVQITVAPLWKLFRHKPWQKVLKDTWVKLEKGDYDWAHLAMNYWPERVRDKCVTDKSLAIAHGLEHLYVEPEPVEKKARGRKKAGSTE